jgi:hypothetical protein
MLSLLLGFQVLPTWDEMQRGMHAVYRSLTGYKEQWVVVINGDKSSEFLRLIDGDRFYQRGWLDDVPLNEMAFDGTTLTVVDHARETYNTGPAKNAWRNEPYQAVTRAKEGFSFAPMGPYSLALLVSPQPVVLSSKNGLWPELYKQPARQIIARATTSKGRPIDLKLWFEPDKWILRRVEASLTADDGRKLTLAAQCKIWQGQKFKAEDFRVKPSVFKGYKIDK